MANTLYFTAEDIGPFTVSETIMEIIQRQVYAARRRLMMQRFGRTFAWSLFALLLIAAIAAVVPKIWDVGVPGNTWLIAWIVGSVTAAFMIAGLVTYLTRPSLNEAAIEVDQRFELRERLSSTLSLDAEAAETEIGRALIADAEKRAEKISISERFAFQFNRRGLMPLIPVVFLIVMIFIPDATGTNLADASVDKTAQAEAQQVKTAAEQLKKKLQQQRRRAAAEGLKEAEDLFKNLERQVDDINKREAIDRKEALIALNDIKKALEERRDQLGSPDQMRKALSGMKEMESGPAEKVAKALEKGDFAEAKEQVDQLAEKLREGKLTDEEKQQLAKQMEQLQKNVEEAIKKHEQAKQQLQEQIDQAKREGRNEDAAKMQEKLNQMQQMDGQMQQMQKMAEGVKAAQEAMKQGDNQAAADAMQQMADQLGEMQAEMEQMEELQDALDQLSQTKEQMGCKSCNGQGCQQCNGNGQGDKPGEGKGMGKGNGSGDRPEEENDTNFYDSQVRTQPKQGKAVMSGPAGGENRKGVTRQSVQDAVLEAITEESDPLENQALPRSERQHAEQYFNKLREGK